MKKLTKKLAIVALSATLAVSAGVALGVVAYNQEPITASAAENLTVDLKDHFIVDSWCNVGDYTEAALYRIKSPSYTTSMFPQNVCNDRLGEAVLKSVLVNGKSIYDHNAEYKALIASGETSPITWTGMPENTGAPSGSGRYMQANIVEDVNNKTANFAPIFVSFTNHGTAYSSTIDMYIPLSYLGVGEVTSITISSDLSYSADGQVYGVSEDVHFVSTSLAFPRKYVGDIPAPNYNVIETEVKKIDGSNSKTDGSWDSFLRFHLSENDYAGLNTSALSDKTHLQYLNFYDHILLNGKKLGSLWRSNFTTTNPIGSPENPGEQFFNVWNNQNTFGMRWPRSINTADGAAAITEIKILAGCQFPSATDFGNTVYEVKEDTVLLAAGNGIFVSEKYALTGDDITISEATVAGDAGELYQVNIAFDKWPAVANGDIYDVNYSSPERQAVRQNILINGVSLFDINANTDDSAYEYGTHPWNSTTDGHADIFQHPTLVTVKEGVLSVFIHKAYIESLGVNTVELTIKSGFVHYLASDYITVGDLTATAWKKPCTVNVITGNPRMNPDCVTTVECKYGDTFKVSELVAPTAVGKTFAGWTDVEGNAITEDFTVTESTAIYAAWTVEVYTLTIVNGETTTEIKFGVENDGKLDATVAELAWILEDELPAEDNYNTYAWDVEVPETFELKDYTFTVVATEKVYTVTVITGNPRLDPNCAVTTEHKYGDTFKVSELVAPTAVGKTFAGWMDVEGNAITEDFTITESTAIYANWTVEVYTLTIVNGETTTEIKFGVENDGTLDATVAELAWILESELPAETETHTYAWDVEIPEAFELKDYTFTVVATEKEVESSDTTSGDSSDTTSGDSSDTTSGDSSDTTSGEEKPGKSGCGSAIGSTLAITGIALAASALIIKKRKED